MQTLRIPALAFDQSRRRTLYTFALDGRLLSSFATISRVHRDEAGTLLGYQRPEIRHHVAAIRRYLESDKPCLPNALVLAFDDSVRFEPARGRPRGNLRAGSVGRYGMLVIPVDPMKPGHAKPAWVVDGQQRMMALQDTDPDRLPGPFPVCVVAFTAANEQEQREQFILVNSTRPLRKSLVYELLPATETPLPPALESRRFPSIVLDHLNRSDDSPFFRRISTPTCPSGDINDNSVLRMVEHSLTDGILFRYCGNRSDSHNTPFMVHILKEYWWAVRETFSDAWGLPPRESRLTHGSGIVAMGYLMDAAADRLKAPELFTRTYFAHELSRIATHCRWTKGVWSFGPGQQRHWYEIQNVGADIHLLTYFLLSKYLQECDT